MAKRVLVTDYAWPSLEIERSILDEVGAELLVAQSGHEAELVSLAPAADAILTNWKKVPRAALDAAPQCLVVSRYGIGVDNIPVEHATTLGILVTNVPDFCLEEVSDHTLALLLACARRVTRFDRLSHTGQWDLSLARGLPRLRDQTLGLIGFGHTARAVVPKALGFGLRVLAYTPRLQPGREDGAELTNDLEKLLSEADYVSLHAPSTPSTRGLIGEAELRTMKTTGYLINTSRGALVNEGDLLRALREGWIAGAALDVLGQEPPPPSHPLLACDNAVITPHAAFYSDASIAEVEAKATRNVVDVLCGRLPANVVNPAVTHQGNFRLARNL